ncbi:MAG: hypothetical protein AVDCRST_MAG10-2222 [uncultured Acidimicrobiales bacterium]|uniref:Uncharacterized protein n=1 Tax=uncultured Acidimicrobiales bacterium TaxID=310071 RepID=A0A6J4II42_9ACTN|nr:MAG: hypothetical protein AVDCRST_MAG10-2222 [uncultured Acidimicrobiales bacterium]
MNQEPWISAVVTLSVPANDLASITPAKAHFTSAGFEVHAPLGSSFGIAGPKSLFESTFDRVLMVNDQELVTSVTTESGEADLPLDSLPESLRKVTESVRFIEPPPLVFG